MYNDINTRYGEIAGPLVVTDTASVNNFLLNLLSCRIGSRPHNREYGTRLHEALFEPADEKTKRFIKIQVFQAIARWIPPIRMDMRKSSITSTPDGLGFIVSIYYRIQGVDAESSCLYVFRR